MNEWLDIMLSEIARKNEEESAAIEETKRRSGQQPDNKNATEKSSSG